MMLQLLDKSTVSATFYKIYEGNFTSKTL